MINILEILKKIPNLKDIVFWSSLFGNTKVKLHLDESDYKIWIYPEDSKHMGTFITDYGLYNINYNGECVLYPSKENRDWSTFKVPRKVLPKGAQVMVSNDKELWNLRIYYEADYCYIKPGSEVGARSWNYIIPVNKFNFDTWAFKEEDNYGTSHKE